MDKRVIVFAKAPRAGETKTRLIPRLGAQGAADLHARLIEHALQQASTVAHGSVELHGTPADDDFLRHCTARYGATLIEQSGGDLGERMHAAFERALERDRCSSAVLIGSDCPALTARHIRLALSTLANGHDAVFAPVEDGGYALVGLSRLDLRVFRDIAWGTDGVMETTRTRLSSLGWRWSELETLWDVDRPEDYDRLVESGLLGKL